MEVLYPRCGGLDVHATQVTACVRVMDGGRVTRHHERFATTSRGLLALADWLAQFQCTHVAMEATGVYWRPVWHVLEAQFALCWPTPCTFGTCPGARAI
jgi:hypothetical protein